jgi:guanylate cyclase
MERVPTGYQPSGLAAALAEPTLVVRLLHLLLLLAATNSAMLAVLYRVYDEPGAALVSVVQIGLYGACLADFRRHGGIRRVVLLVVAGSAACNLACHVLLGGYLWSGAVFLWCIALTVHTAMYTDSRATAVTVGCFCLAALVLAVVEPALQAARQQPALVVSIAGLVNLVVVSLVSIAPGIVVLVSRLRLEQARSRRLLLNVLPATVADRLQDEQGPIADLHPGCTVVFADLVGFTAHARGRPPRVLLAELNTIFTAFDTLCAQHRAEKIKTIGDGYLAVCGLPQADPDHLRNGCGLGLAMQDAMPALNARLRTSFSLRVGVHTGELVAGVIGSAKFSYDVWGETVNLASRLESAGAPGHVMVSQTVAERLGTEFASHPVGTLSLRGHGATSVFTVSRQHQSDLATLPAAEGSAPARGGAAPPAATDTP